MAALSKDEIYELFRANLRAYRVESGLSQSELARRLGTVPSYICDLESGRRTGVTIGTVAQIAEQLGIAPSSMLSLIRTPHAIRV